MLVYPTANFSIELNLRRTVLLFCETIWQQITFEVMRIGMGRGLMCRWVDKCKIICLSSN